MRRTVSLLLAAAGPLAFPLSQMGYGSLERLAVLMVLPAATGLVAIGWWDGRRSSAVVGSLLARGALWGTLATFALETIRYPGFRLGFMPGNLPRLMGVLLLDRFAQGPSLLSDLAGFGLHFWTGACFGMILTLASPRRGHIWAVPYGLAIGAGFLMSPVVQAIGAGFFGKDLGWTFAATVFTAHAAYGLVLAAGLRGTASRLRPGARAPLDGAFSGEAV